MLADHAASQGCRGFTGPVPPPLEIRACVEFSLCYLASYHDPQRVSNVLAPSRDDAIGTMRGPLDKGYRGNRLAAIRGLQTGGRCMVGMQECGLIIIRHGPMVNSYALCGTHTVLIDAGHARHGRRIRNALPHHKAPLTDVSLLLVTHAHGDHAGGADFLRRSLHIPVAAHEDAVPFLRAGKSQALAPVTFFGRLLTALGGGSFPSVEVSVIVGAEGLDLCPYGVSARAIWTPGHTPDSLSVVVEGGPAIVGDLLFGGLRQRKVPHLPPLIHDREALLSSVERVLSYGPTEILAGHGGPFTTASVVALLRGERGGKD